MQVLQDLSLEWKPRLSRVSVQSPSQKTALHSKMKSSPKCSMSLLSRFLSTPAWSRILILGLPLLSRETFMHSTCWVHDLRSQPSFSTPGDGAWPYRYFGLCTWIYPAKEKCFRYKHQLSHWLAVTLRKQQPCTASSTSEDWQRDWSYEQTESKTAASLFSRW